MINIRDEKTGTIYRVDISHLKMLECTKGSIRLIFKDTRQPDITIKAKQITFD